MVSSQEHLEKKYFEKENIKEIVFDSEELEFNQAGELIIADYSSLKGIITTGENNIKNVTKVTIHNCPQLKEINITNFIDNQGLEIINCPNLEYLYCGNNQCIANLDVSVFPNLKELQCWNNQLTALDSSNNNELAVLGCSRNKLTNLKLNNLTNLEELNYSENQLTNLDLTDLNNLKKIYCRGNYLTNINHFLNCDKLTSLDIRNNDLSKQNLSVFSRLVNLEELLIGNDDKKRIKQGIFNCFHGSLENLNNLTKLKNLNIDNTDINSGWGYLPNNIEWISFSSKKRPSSKVKEIYEQLKWICKGFGGQQLKEWIEIGFQPNDYGFALYLTRKGYRPQSTLNYTELRGEYNKSQSWLDRNYPKENRNGVKDIYLNEPSLSGELDLRDFTYKSGFFNINGSIDGVKVYISYTVNASKLVVKNKSECSEIIKLVNAQEYLNYYYPAKESKKKLTWLDISEQSLEGDLDLSDFINLEELTCWRNKLISLKIRNCLKLKEFSCSINNLTNLELTNFSQLRELNCSNNKITNLSIDGCDNLEELHCSDNQLDDLDLLLTGFNPKKLKHLDLSNNKFTNDLAMFNKFINLEDLRISSNSFTGSLVFLQNCTKLNYLDINSTDLDNGLEYLPESIEYFVYSNYGKKIKSKVKKIVDQLTPYEVDGKEGIKNWREWRKRGFREEENKGWIEISLKANEYELANYLKQKGYETTAPNIKQIIKQEAWRDIHPNFDYQLRKKWENNGFTEEKVKNWIRLGVRPNDYGFISGLRDSEQFDSEQILNKNKEIKSLQESYNKYWNNGLCQNCQQPNTNRDWHSGWCKSCSHQDFQKITIDNREIAEFIRKQQLEATEKEKSLVWIPYEKFTNIEHLADGGFSKIFKAKWNEDKNGFRWVVLKSLNDSQNRTAEFLTEITNYKLFTKGGKNFDIFGGYIVNCYGISQDPKSKNYVMVMQYVNGGNLREYLQNNIRRLKFGDKFKKLIDIANGLNLIHEQGLVHRDLHAGNVLNTKDRNDSLVPNHCRITDLGLAKPTSETDDGKIYGVTPYVAPEVLQGKPYAPASDIYSFGIIAYELLSGLPPYYDRSHGLGLQLKICQGLRPQFQIKIPPLLEELINRCWDADPGKRPSAEELFSTLDGWYGEIIYKKNTEFTQQVQVAETYNQNLPKEIKYPKVKIHPQVIYTSRLIDTKIITQSLSTLKIAEQHWGSKDINLDINDLNLENKETKQTSRIEIPPKSRN